MLEKHFTATIYILYEEKVLLLFHKKLQKWLPPGGHLEANELPCDGAKREAYEETGLEVELITQENIWIQRPNAQSFERPYLCLLEEIPPHKETPAHQHMDFVYIARPKHTPPILQTDEDHLIRWFSLGEMENLESEVVIFEETKETIRHLFQAFAFEFQAR